MCFRQSVKLNLLPVRQLTGGFWKPFPFSAVWIRKFIFELVNFVRVLMDERFVLVLQGVVCCLLFGGGGSYGSKGSF